MGYKLGFNVLFIEQVKVKVNIKQSHYRLLQAQRVPGS